MIKYKVSKSNEPISILRIITSYQFRNGFVPIMQTLIDYFNTEYKWNDMFSVDDVEKRLDEGHILFILWYQHKPIGYVFFKEIDSTTTFLYNFYVTKIVDRDKDVPIKLVNSLCKEMLREYNNIELECEDWNIAAQNIFEINGFQKIND